MGDIEKNQEKGGGNNKVPLLHKKDDSRLFMVYFSTLISVCGSYSFGTSMGYSSPSQEPIMDELHLSYSQFSVVGSILTIGAMLGAITCGRIADYLGRKGAMRLSSAICTVGWLAIYYAKGAGLLYLGRFLTGYSSGTLSYVVPVFIGEITPSRLRGALASLNQLFIVIGISVFYGIGTFVTWRVLALTGIIPCLILFVGVFFIPESPRWLAVSGKPGECEAALRTLRGPNADISKEVNDIKEYIVSLEELPKVSVMSLFDESNRPAVIISVGLMAFQQFVGINGIVFYSNSIFMQAGFDPRIGSITYALLQVFVTAIGAMLIDRSGRRPILLISASGLLLGSLLIALSFLFKTHAVATDVSPYLAVIGVLVYIGSFSIGMGAGPWVIMAEVYPLHVKGLGGGLVTLMNWFGSWVVSFSFNFLMLWSTSGTFFLDAIICFLSIIFIFKMVPETKGRTLEEIHASLRPSK
ncbi:hypothetical protein M9H77_27809 [Catharanthus roseus]|uniref:Uncharacterized protein n=1 Tax=Catharanthus roseus TaxID=4058 RepID=A0ACC0AEK8_CATRO|nr:hypothetical protein M9H77_27809 [Catharanthus roseus]